MNYDHFPQLDITNVLSDMDIMDFDILLCSGNGAFSKLIQAGTGSPWSHAGVLRRTVLDNSVLVAESVESIGVRLYPLQRYIDEYDGGVVIARHAELTQFHRPYHDAIRLIDSRIGNAYDNVEIARIAARISRSWRDGHNDYQADDVDICSEFTNRVYTELGLPFTPDERGFIAPSTIATDPNVELMYVLKGK